MSVRIERTKYEPIPIGIYPASIVAIDLDDTSEYGSQLKFKFLLDPFEGYESGKELHAWASARFSPKSKLFKWTQSILGNIPDDYAFESDDLINKRVMLVIDHNVKPDGAVFDKVESIKPLRAPVQKAVQDINFQLEEVEAESPF
jgi:hypothetical protein